MRFVCRCVNTVVTVDRGNLCYCEGVSSETAITTIVSHDGEATTPLETVQLSETGDAQWLKLKRDECTVEEKMKWVVKAYNFGQYTVHCCLLCNNYTVAVDRLSGKSLLVNENMITDESVIRSLELSPNFSAVFGVVLPKIDSSLCTANTQTYGSAVGLCNRKAVQHMQAQINQYLKHEQEAMDQRIRLFAEGQLKDFESVKLHANNQMLILLSFLAQKNNLKTSEDENESAVPPSPAASLDSGVASPGIAASGARAGFHTNGRATGYTEVKSRTLSVGDAGRKLQGDYGRPKHFVPFRDRLSQSNCYNSKSPSQDDSGRQQWFNISAGDEDVFCLDEHSEPHLPADFSGYLTDDSGAGDDHSLTGSAQRLSVASGDTYDDSEMRATTTRKTSGVLKQQNFGNSVPMRIPQASDQEFHLDTHAKRALPFCTDLYKLNAFADDEEDIRTPEGDVEGCELTAENFTALARSVHSSDSLLFDRPKRRYPTGELARARQISDL